MVVALRKGQVEIMAVHKFGTDDNLSDALTKGWDAAAIHRHLEGVGIQIRTERHTIAPELHSKVQRAEEKCEDE